MIGFPPAMSRVAIGAPAVGRSGSAGAALAMGAAMLALVRQFRFPSNLNPFFLNPYMAVRSLRTAILFFIMKMVIKLVWFLKIKMTIYHYKEIACYFLYEARLTAGKTQKIISR
jgi:hypothetical protein